MSRDHLGGNHAVVIGASVVGLLAARVLAGHFDRVTVVERHRLPVLPPAPDAGLTPPHVHALLARGAHALEQLFPGLFAELEEAGAVRLDQAADVRAYVHGDWKDRYQSGFAIHCVSRPLLEWTLRQRLARLRNVLILDEATVDHLLSTADGRIIRGVQVTRDTMPETLIAELVVDAGGRDSRVAEWLYGLGFGTVPTSSVRLDLVLASRVFRMPSPGPDWKALTIATGTPCTRSGFLLPVEGDRWVASVWGYFGDHPTGDFAQWMEFARSLPVSDLYEAVDDATALGEIRVERFPGHLRRHYERMERFPEGLAVLGDAACSFSPVYGQGLTMGALGALELDACLKAQPKWQIAGLSQRFRHRLAAVLDVPWHLATSADLGQQRPDPRRPASLSMVSKYTHRLLAAATHDRELNDAFLQAMNMVKPPESLFAPGTVRKVLTAALPG
jgi:2-polyprenyl-6-methoxyphenol hydroxylase-like FAD-dependent oxidoreductase